MRTICAKLTRSSKGPAQGSCAGLPVALSGFAAPATAPAVNRSAAPELRDSFLRRWGSGERVLDRQVQDVGLDAFFDLRNVGLPERQALFHGGVGVRASARVRAAPA